MMTGDGIWYSDGKGNAAVPPADQIENPDPLAGTNNWYTQDGYSGGTYSECADSTQPGVAGVNAYLASLPRPVSPNCDDGHYYLLNNYSPGYFGDGTRQHRARSSSRPRRCATSATSSSSATSRGRYFGDQFDNYLADNNLYDAIEQPVLRHLQRLPVLDVDHDERLGAHRAPEGHHRPLRRHPGRVAPGGLVRQAERLGRRAPGVVEVGPVRGLLEEDRRHGPGGARSYGTARPSSSRPTRAAATTTRATCSRSTSSATARASR